MILKGMTDLISSDSLDKAVEASRLTLPYLIKKKRTLRNSNHKNLKTPWQSVGAKGVVTLASKLMLALLPVKLHSSSCKWMRVS